LDTDAEEGDQKRGLIRADDETAHGGWCAAKAVDLAASDVRTNDFVWYHRSSSTMVNVEVQGW
jgi:hypothetical protein